MESYLGPAVPLNPVLVEGAASLQDGFVDPSAASDTANHGTVSGGDDLEMTV